MTTENENFPTDGSVEGPAIIGRSKQPADPDPIMEELRIRRELLKLAQAAAENGYAAFTNQGKWDREIHDAYREGRLAAWQRLGVSLNPGRQ